MDLTSSRAAFALIAAIVACALFAPPALAVRYRVQITGAGHVYDQLNPKRLDCSSPISTPQGRVGSDCTVDYPNAWGITFTPEAASGWMFDGWQGTDFGDASNGKLHCDSADDSDWLPATTRAVCSFGTSVFGDPLWGVEARFKDVRDPETDITSGTTGRIGPTGSVSWTFGEPPTVAEGSSFQCQFNAGTWTSCRSGTAYPVSQFPQADNTFSVRAVDPSGNYDKSPATRTWHIDREAPATTIDTGPTSPSSSHSATFTFSTVDESGDSQDSISCRLDSGAWTTCANAMSGSTRLTVGDGVHVFYARGVDRYGNTDQTPAEWQWVVDTGPPDTTIASGPAPGERTASTGATFGFTSEPGARFECKLDSGPFVACSGPGNFHTVSMLSDGSHTFSVRAIDAVGNVDATPATRTWSVDTVAPDTAITSGPPQGATLYTTAVSVTFASEPGAAFECSLDAAAFGPCSGRNSYTVAGLAPGAHRIRVRAVDVVGNRDPSPGTRSFTVALPVLSIATATMRVHWHRSALESAVLRLRGNLSGGNPGRLQIGLNGGMLASSVGPNAFDVPIPLSRSVRAHMLPGANTLTLGGSSNGLPIARATHAVRVPSPREGVVMAAKISTRKNGPPLSRISSAKRLWATFRFAPKGRPKKAIRAYWSRNGKALGDFPAAAPSAFSWYGRPAGLKKGTYTCNLKMGKVVIKRLAIRVG